MKDKTGRPTNIPLAERNYHDLEQRSLGIQHSQGTINITQQITSITVNETDVTQNFIITNTYYDYSLLLIDCSGGDITVTLPAISAVPHKRFMIKKIDSTSHAIRVKPAGTDLIDNTDEWVINFQYNCMELANDGDSDWYLI